MGTIKKELFNEINILKGRFKSAAEEFSLKTGISVDVVYFELMHVNGASMIYSNVDVSVSVDKLHA